MPVGAVMAWPSSSTPSSGGVWLECNGQSIPGQYKQLIALIGSKTPDYRGIFLRGYGSQTVKAYQGFIVKEKNQKYSSGNLGEIQTDAMRTIHFNLFNNLTYDLDNWGYLNNILGEPTYLNNWNQAAGVDDHRFPIVDAYGDGSGAYNAQSAGYQVGQGVKFKKRYWMMTRPPKRYSVSGSSDRGYNFREYDDTSSGEYLNVWASDWGGWTEAGNPTASENRPVNMAVRYFIKAR